MRHFQSEKYTIAWFKLADFVSRGEKERALSLYRLLMHSIDDEALSYQLAGDLFLSFNDEQAFEKYAKAAELYIQQNRFLQAAAVYQKMFSNDRKSFEHSIVLLYAHKTLEVIMQTDAVKARQFLAEINAVNETLYNLLCEQLSQ